MITVESSKWSKYTNDAQAGEAAERLGESGTK